MTYDAFESIPAVMLRRAKERPDKAFLTLDGVQLTYGELERRSAIVAGFLHESGIGPGDRVGLMLDNSLEFLFVWFGIVRLGAIEVPLNTSLRGKHLEYIVGNCGMRMLVIDDSYLPRLREIELPAVLQEIVVRGGNTSGTSAPAAHIAMRSFREMLERGAGQPVPDVDLTIASPAAIIYTSGTSGPSKGVVCPHGHLLALGSETLELLEVGPNDVMYDGHPLYHAHSQGQAVLGAMIGNVPLVMRKTFSASGFIQDMADYGITTAFLIGAAGLVLKQPPSPKEKDYRLRVICAVPVPRDQQTQLEQRFRVPVVDLYGMSEMGVITSNPLSRCVEGSCGIASAYREIAIVDELDRPVPTGQVGQIVVRPTKPWRTFLQYWNMPDKSIEAFRNLWFHTGDAGRVDANGYLYFVGRIKDSIRRRGENISAFEVEQVINAHPEVLESAVLPYPSPVGEDDVWVVVVTTPQSQLSAPELLTYCEGCLPKFAVPRYIQFERELPKTPTERIEKYKLSTRGLGEHVFDRESVGGIAQ
jgi:crotonobetaine/carnitine-CoA ligase